MGMGATPPSLRSCGRPWPSRQATPNPPAHLPLLAYPLPSFFFSFISFRLTVWWGQERLDYFGFPATTATIHFDEVRTQENLRHILDAGLLTGGTGAAEQDKHRVWYPHENYIPVNLHLLAGTLLDAVVRGIDSVCRISFRALCAPLACRVSCRVLCGALIFRLTSTHTD